MQEVQHTVAAPAAFQQAKSLPKFVTPWASNSDAEFGVKAALLIERSCKDGPA
jgi:hypothetical protein